jgi:NAD(P)-dependent dehydrogenase (short-subunit alcohol dehydrogenase family)
MPEPGSKRILITGAAAGIGLAIAHRLASDGAALVLADRDESGLARICEEISARGTAVTGLPGDLADTGTIDAVAEAAGVLDGLVNCAGIYPVTPVLELSADEWDRVLTLNLRTPFLLTRAVAKRMISAGRGGSIVNISSTASVLARPGIAHYGASKAGLNQLTRVFAVELAPHGIRVNAVLPGVIETETVKASQTTAAAVAEMAAKRARIPMGRLGTPAEIAEMAAFLLSPAASYATGALISADGGFSLGIASYE